MCKCTKKKSAIETEELPLLRFTVALDNTFKLKKFLFLSWAGWIRSFETLFLFVKSNDNGTHSQMGNSGRELSFKNGKS